MRRRSSFGHVYQPKGRAHWYVRFHWEGRRIVRLGGKTRSAAGRKRSRVHALLLEGMPLDEVLAEVFGDPSGARLTFAETAGLYLKAVQRTKKASTVKSDTQRLRMICRSRWAGKYLSRVRSEDISRWVVERMASGTSGATVNRDVSLISAVFRWSMEQGLTPENPTARVRRHSERGRAREVYLTANEAGALMKAAEDDLRFLLHCALATGMRRGELLQLRWSHIDLDRRIIHVAPENEKTGRGRSVPLTDDLLRELAQAQAARKVFQLDREDPVLVCASGSVWTESRLRQAFAKAREGCKSIPKEKRDRLRFHDLRHTAASLMVGAGIPLYDVGKVLGHTTPQTTARYAHLAPEAQRRAVDALGDALGIQRGSDRETAG